jgi:hypothetical protein
MKHLLNDLTEKEKNSIREQHTGGMKVVTENFSRLINTKSGEVKPLVNEQMGDDESLIDCEQLFLTMEFIFNDFMDSISTSPDEIESEDAEGIYDDFEIELTGIIDLAYRTECNDETIQELEIMYDDYLREISEMLGLHI